ncbi:hypothetical protein F3I27_12590 [Pantoea sp. Bo_2]|uniref:hypothetical protein n=1 Tax=unclassified Pantoea TaxID=2630326 RepID=UPI00123185C8|nr:MULTISPECIES: hypothetical protein [unclassified Pantoea]KAA5936445.1 hypothetical protein F3I57_22615 [Pantoea sp. VH_3]KAA5949691.1 hypothetical protein F3I56_17570 [Pantoea sp. VH_25]KAA5955418.1 hypothetical protein F3I55_12635 [Pantoea sp. VH_24]KAA5958961.1 hypothetical protein F3I53_13615 [Pantoea sp. VH_16]KAA5964159.1 hypothetical protein F3I54_13455 [Pantoea sp. VH_18]
MFIPDHLIPEINESTRPVIIYRNDDGSFAWGFVLRNDEFVASMKMIKETSERAGIQVLDAGE